MLRKRIFTFFCFGTALALLAASLPMSSSAALRNPEKISPRSMLTTDAFGYTDDDSVVYSWSPASSNSGLTGDDKLSGAVNIGFIFPFYKNAYTQLRFSTNGLITFTYTLGPDGLPTSGNTEYNSQAIPYDPQRPDNFIAAFWDDLVIGTVNGVTYNTGAVYTSQGGTAPNRYFIVEWRNVTELIGDGTPFSFEVILHENGDIVIQYASLPTSYFSSIGIENDNATIGLQYFHGNSGLAAAPNAIRFYSPPLISGNAQVAGATLTFDNNGINTVPTFSGGYYSFLVSNNWTGTVTPSKTGYTFVPPSISYSNVTSDQTAQNYIAYISISGNVGVAGATLSYDDGGPQTVTSDGSGNYAISVPYTWSGTVTPSLGADAFCPPNQAYSNLTTSKPAQNYAHETCPPFTAISKWTNSFDLGHGWTVSQYVRTVGDVNNDGRADLVGFGQDGVYVALSTGSSFGSASKWTSAFDQSHGWTVSQHVRTVGDVNGDGNTDLVGFGQDGVYIALSTGSGFGAISKWTSSFDLSHGWTVSDYVRTVGDVDGDGMADLVGFGQDGVYIALSTGSSFGAISKWTSSFDLSHGWTVSQYVRTVGDVDDDGMADLVGFGQDGVYIALSTGSGFGTISQWTSAFDLSHGWTVSQYVRTVGDINGDGKTDLVGFGQDGVYVSLSMGTSFTLPSRRSTSFDLSHGWTVNNYVRTVGDVNNDGKADPVGFGQDGVYVALAQ